MLKKIYIKLKNVNLIDLLKRLLKGMLINGIKLTVAYQISIFVLGYTLFTPLLVRLFNLTQKSNVAECFDWGFSIGSATKTQQSLSGLTWEQIIIGGIVLGVTYYGINYVGEKLMPPFLRYCGYDYYTTNEKLAMQAQKLDTLSEKISALNHNLGIVNNNVENLAAYVAASHQNIQNGILHAQQTLVALTTELYNRMGNIANNEIIPLKRNVDSLLLHLGSIENIIQNQSENALSPDIFRTEMERLIAQFNDEHAQISNNIRRVMVSLQEQVDSLDPNDINQASERLQSHIAFLENVLRTHAESGTRVRETIQSTIEEVATQLEVNQQQLTVASNTVANISQDTNYPTINTESVLSGSAASFASQQTEMPTRVDTNTDLVETSNSALTLTRAGANTGSYTIETEGNEILIRLKLSDSTNTLNALKAIASNEATTQVMRSSASYMRNTLIDMTMGAAASGAVTVFKGALVGGLKGMLNGMLSSGGFRPIMRLTSAPSTYLRPEQLEAAAKASEAGDKLGTVITVVKEFTKSAWKYI